MQVLIIGSSCHCDYNCWRRLSTAFLFPLLPEGAHWLPLFYSTLYFVAMPSKILKKSGKKKNAKAGKKWNDSEMVLVLAWADHNLELDPTSGWQRFGETVETHLQEACGALRTQAQILGKVDRIWGAYGRGGVFEYPNLIKVEGSRCLENPDFVWHKAIDKRKKVLAHENFVEQLSTRTTRSASKPGHRHVVPYRSALKLDLGTSPLLREKARDISGPQKPRPKTRNVSRKRIQASLHHN